MERNKQLYEIIIKIVYGVFAFFVAFLILTDLISMFSLFNLKGLDENQIYIKAISTHIGNVLYEAEPINEINFEAIIKLFFSFLKGCGIIPFIFLILTLFLSVLSFLFPNWKLPFSYLTLSLMMIALYIFKAIFFGVIVFIFYKNEANSLRISIYFANSFYIILSLVELSISFLWVLKVTLNIKNDIINLKKLNNL